MRKYVCLILCIIFCIVLCSCSGGLSEAQLKEICHDYSMLTTKADQQTFLSANSKFLSGDVINTIRGLPFSEDDLISATVFETVGFIDRDTDVFIYYCTVMRSRGINPTKLITVQLNASHTKILSFEVLNLYSYNLFGQY